MARNCWNYLDCPPERREQCPAFLQGKGQSCWEVAGTLCHGEVQGSMAEKIERCRECAAYRELTKVRFGVGRLLALSFGAVLILFAAVIALAVYNIQQERLLYHRVFHGEVFLARRVNDAASLAQQAALSTRSFLITGWPYEADQATGLWKNAEDQLMALEPYFSGETKKAWEMAREMFGPAKEAAMQAMALKEESRKLKLSGQDNRAKEEELQEFVAANGGKIKDYLTACQALVQRLDNMQKEALDAAYAQAATLEKAMISLSLLAFVLGGALAFVLGRQLTARIHRLDAAVRQLASGDLTGSIEEKRADELGRLARSLNELIAGMKDVLGRLVERASHLKEAAGQLDESAQQISAAASDSAATVQEVARGTENAAQNVEEVAQRARLVAENARKGASLAQKMDQQVQSVSQATAEVGKIASQLDSSLVRISEIVSLITQITEQTNLLALNAAIEAARAGEHGRGFAVVAEEVRKLALQSGGAAREIQQIIEEILSAAKQMVAAVEANRREMKATLEAVNQASQAFRAIMEEVGELAQRTQDVAAAVEEISASMESVAATNEEQAAATQELSSTASLLRQLSEELYRLSNRYRF